MFNKLKDVIVNKISIVTNKETPAVPKATTKYALFKTKKGQQAIRQAQKLDKIASDLEMSIKLDHITSNLTR